MILLKPTSGVIFFPFIKVVAGCKYVVHMACPLPTETPKDEMEQIRPALAGKGDFIMHIVKRLC